MAHCVRWMERPKNYLLGFTTHRAVRSLHFVSFGSLNTAADTFGAKSLHGFSLTFAKRFDLCSNFNLLWKRS